MISHLHKCIFTHVPKTAGKTVLSAFGLPMLGSDYDGSLDHIAQPYAHEPLALYLGHHVFGYYKFAFVRNPWDRVVSGFFYLNAGGCNAHDRRLRDTELMRYRGDFNAFVRDLHRYTKQQHFAPQVHWLCDDAGHVLPDFVGRFETIDADFELVAERLALPPILPRRNASVHRPYRMHYDEEAREIVASIYARDIEVFGYAF